MKQLSAHELKSRMAWNQANEASRTDFITTNNIHNGIDYIHTRWAKLPLTIKEELLICFEQVVQIDIIVRS